jgi:hypothetical protein
MIKTTRRSSWLLHWLRGGLYRRWQEERRWDAPSNCEWYIGIARDLEGVKALGFLGGHTHGFMAEGGLGIDSNPSPTGGIQQWCRSRFECHLCAPVGRGRRSILLDSGLVVDIRRGSKTTAGEVGHVVAVSSMPKRRKTMDVFVSLSMKRYLGRLWADLAGVWWWCWASLLGCTGQVNPSLFLFLLPFSFSVLNFHF